MKLVATLPFVLAAVWAAGPRDVAVERDVVGAGVLARQWATSLFAGDVEVAMALCDVPFAWDRTKLIVAGAELRDMFKSVVEDKGDRKLPVFEVAKVDEVSKIEDDLFPKSYYDVHLVLAGETIRVAVRHGDVMRVIGFSD